MLNYGFDEKVNCFSVRTIRVDDTNSPHDPPPCLLVNDRAARTLFGGDTPQGEILQSSRPIRGAGLATISWSRYYYTGIVSGCTS